jgi:two-component system, NtrC family, response regulator GlrR
VGTDNRPGDGGLGEGIAVTAGLARPPQFSGDLTRVCIEVVAGPSVGRRFEAAAERIVIGTHESATVQIQDSTVSRFHCEIVRVGGEFLVRDLGSRNGTYINDIAIREAFYPPAATLVLGETRLMLRSLREQSAEAPGTRERFGLLSGRSTAMRRVISRLERVAATNATVLLLGETGTGKELAAESIHRESPRADHPFIVVDCGAIPSELLESELFGHERGAFTGAVRSREGAFTAAAGGTIFLDEIGELPRALQPKLLRALSRRAVKPVGREAYVDVDVRVVAATNRDLRQEVNVDRFRSDLYYRLAVVEVWLPPLRERLDDIPMLVEAMLRESRAMPFETSRLLSAASLDQLRDNTWPGNIRELRNAIDRALALGPWESQGGALASTSPELTSEAAREPEISIDLSRPFKDARDDWTAAFERAYLAALLREHGGNIRAAARAAGIDRVHLYRLLARHGLRRGDDGAASV